MVGQEEEEGVVLSRAGSPCSLRALLRPVLVVFPWGVTPRNALIFGAPRASGQLYNLYLSVVGPTWSNSYSG